MKSILINSCNFNKYFKTLLEIKDEKNIVKGQFNLDNLVFEDRIAFIIKFISSINPVLGITYKILFWERDTKIKRFFNSTLPQIKYKIATTYKDGKIPGVIFVDDTTIDFSFFEKLLRGHFNFEMANEPSFNGRLQICISSEHLVFLLDIYDDRGFHIYFK